MTIELTETEARAVGKVLTSQYARDVMRLDEDTYYRTVAKFTRFDEQLLRVLAGDRAVEAARRNGALA